MFSDHNGIKLEINDKENQNNFPGNKETSNDSPVKEEMMKAIRKYAELNDNENNTN